MKSPLAIFPWTRGSLLLFVFITLSVPHAQCEIRLGRALDAIKGRLDHALRKVGVGNDKEPVAPRDMQDGRNAAGVPEYPPSPMTDPQPPSGPVPPESSPKKAENTENPAKKSKPSAVVNSSTKTRVKPKPSATNSNAPVTRDKQPQIATDNAPKTKPSKGATTPPVLEEPQSTAASKAAPIPSEVKISFAKPVPGKRGFVYSPGMAEEMGNILDVRGSSPGQKMRDPRTGNMFLVP